MRAATESKHLPPHALGLLAQQMKTKAALFSQIKNNDTGNNSRLVSLRPTATVVRDRKGRVRIERQELLSDSECRERIMTSIEAHKKRKGVPPPNTELLDFPIVSGILYEHFSGEWKPRTKNTIDAASLTKAENRNADPPESLRVVSWNVWYSEYEWEVRLDALLRICVEKEAANIICLQEVTTRFLKKLMEYPIVQEKYRMVMARKPKSWYAVCMLIDKLNIFYGTLPTIRVVSKMPSTMGRQALIAAFEYRKNGSDATTTTSTFAVATVHLESLKSQKTRSQQLQHIRQHLSGYDNALLVGDYNIADTGPWADVEESQDVLADHLGSEYVDWWTEKHPNTVGATFDSETNSMLGLHSRFKDFARYDRACLRLEPQTEATVSWAAADIRILGDESVGADPNGKPIFCSDHFGLAMELKCA